MTYVLYGTIEYLIKAEINKILDANHIDHMSISKYNLVNESLITIINDADSISLFEDKKAIIVDNSYIFTGSTNKKNPEQDTTILEQYLEHQNENTTLIFIVDNDKLDERKKITKLAKKSGIAKEFNSADTVKLVKDFFEDYSISIENIKFLIDRVGDNILLLSSEIDKIKLYKDENKEISREDIIELTSKSLEINNFKLIDAIVSKNKKLAIELYNERLKLNEEPIAILIALANQIRIMYQVKELYAMGHTEKDIATIISIHPYRVKLAAINAKKYNSDVLLNYLEKLADLDIAIKTGKTDKIVGLELFILSL